MGRLNRRGIGTAPRRSCNRTSIDGASRVRSRVVALGGHVEMFEALGRQDPAGGDTDAGGRASSACIR